MVVPGLARQAEGPLAEVVALHFVGAAADGEGVAREQLDLGPVGDLVARLSGVKVAAADAKAAVKAVLHG